MDEPQGDGVTFACAPAPVVSGVRRVSVRVTWRLHLSQQRRGGRVGEQEQQETEVKMGEREKGLVQTKMIVPHITRRYDD